MDGEAPLGRPVIALASSAGGLGALTAVLEALPADFGPPILVVQHVSPDHPSHMAEILDRATPLTVTEAVVGDGLRPGTVHVAPPDRHLLLGPDRRLELSGAPLVHFLRPSADLLLESLAATCGPDAVAVILSGTGQDGAMGVQAVREVGGTTIAQEPGAAEFGGMAAAAIATGAVDVVLPLERISEALVDLAAER